MIPLDKLLLDTQNPRLPLEARDKSQEVTLEVLVRQFDLTELAYSMVENGYFAEEPLVVIPNNLPKNFTLSAFETIEQKQDALKKLLDMPDVSFIVVEGNRRLATTKILTSPELCAKYRFPTIENPTILATLKQIPALVYEERSDVAAYLGVRHIVGTLKWEAFAKAQFIKERVDELMQKQKMTATEAVKMVGKQIGDKSNLVKKQYAQYQIMEQAEDELGFDIKPIRDNFSLLEVIFRSTDIRNYVGIETTLGRANIERQIVPDSHLERLRDVFTWIFGDMSQGIQRVLTDSRDITGLLAHVMKNEEATLYLKQYKNLEEAYELSEGEKEFVLKKIQLATRSLEYAMQRAYRFPNDEAIRSSVEVCEQALVALKRNV